MSASLVGSEMCIRDSPEASLKLPHASPSFSKPPKSPQASTIQSKPPGAVSYTHLTLPTICSV
eukprot:5340484-Alexandrium_andersonii.AAC.1